MGSQLLAGKTALVFGVANKNSIAWAIAQELHNHGATIALSYAIPQLERRVKPLAEAVGATFVEMCDVSDDAQIAATMDKAAVAFGRIDFLVHAVAFAERDDLTNGFLETSRTGFSAALDVSVYSLVALTKAILPLMPDGGSIMTLTYGGSQRVMPQYNVMGVAKAALEASVRYLSAEIGPHNIRINALSPGPIKTLSAGAFDGFRDLLKHTEQHAPLRRNVTQTDVGNAAVWLASDLSSAVTGEVIYVDGGWHVLGVADSRDE